MGFRDLRGFNTALLSKQLWNLFQRPQSLVARILKAKYHKHSSILEASTGYRSSFIWRSLMSVQEFLWSGLRWDSEIVERCFPADIAEAIMQIPLRDSSEPDIIIYSNSPNGNYTTRAGYAAWLEAYLEANSIVATGELVVWKTLWSLNLPPKVKHFIWRFMHNMLPTGSQLCKRSKR
ncbi:Uncharacterized mitochondrial protein AtMg00310 [Linum grandiflorum]